MLEAWTTLAALSQVTDRAVLGTLVSCAAYRPAAVSVQMARNLQALTAGRFCLGLGAGWDRPEFDALNIPFGAAGGRSDLLQSILQGSRTAWPWPEADAGDSASDSHPDVGRRPPPTRCAGLTRRTSSSSTVTAILGGGARTSSGG